MSDPSPSDAATPPVVRGPAEKRAPYLVFLSGRRRGTLQRLVGKTLRLAVDSEARVRISDPLDPSVADHLVTLHLAGDTYELEVATGAQVWVNGDAVTHSKLLRGGDLIELGRAGPVLRYRFYAPGARPQRSVADVLADGVNGVRHERRAPLTRLLALVAGVAKDLATQTSLWFRIWVIGLLSVLVIVVAGLMYQSVRLEQRMALERIRIEGIAQMLERAERESLRREELQDVRGELEQRLEALEARSQALARIIESVSPSVMFIQGAYGFVDPQTRRPLRFLEIDPRRRSFTLEGDGEIVEIFFTGTAFVASPDSLLITSRHVALPWEGDPAYADVKDHALTPVVQRLLGYLPGRSEPLEVEFVVASDEADVAVLRARDDTAPIQPLPFSPTPPQIGDEIVLLGYPAGIRALLARADPALTEALLADGETDFWEAARRLSTAGYIRPLATRGIVSQVTASAVAYDAETTAGGSGGPVVALDGTVIAVIEAVVPGFAGSNLGVPISFVRDLLERARASP